jgi:hypothetical protein
MQRAHGQTGTPCEFTDFEEHQESIAAPAGARLPVLGWSMTDGDLRVAHFIGIHAGQVQPLVGAAIVALRLPASRSLVWTASGAWTAAFLLTLVQALRGVPLISA